MLLQTTHTSTFVCVVGLVSFVSAKPLGMSDMGHGVSAFVHCSLDIFGW